MVPFPVGGYELNKEDHILALQEDEPIITEALKSHLVSDFMTSTRHGWSGLSLQFLDIDLYDLCETPRYLKHIYGYRGYYYHET